MCFYLIILNRFNLPPYSPITNNPDRRTHHPKRWDRVTFDLKPFKKNIITYYCECFILNLNN